MEKEHQETALIVEGGAMRGIFAAGVLDSFLDKQYKPFKFCMGVSAGATNIASYLTNQRGRSHKIITDYSCRDTFFSFKSYLKGGHYIDLDWLWDIASKEYRLDTLAYERQEIPFYIVTTNVLTGQSEYTLPNALNLEDLLLASCSVPLAYRGYPVVQGNPSTDGGVADSIPVIDAYNRGARHLVVILSQQIGYRKKPASMPWMIRRLFGQYPMLAEAMIRRHIAYNRAIDFINNPPDDCIVDVIAPGDGFDVGRTTTDKDKLDFAYDMGVRAGDTYASNNINSQMTSDQSVDFLQTSP